MEEEVKYNEEVAKETTKPMAKKVTFNKGPQTQKQSKMDALAKKVDIVALYLRDIEGAVQQKTTNLTLAMLEIYDEVFKDCPKVREADITHEDAKSYTQVLMHYYKTDGKMVKIIPIEEGWKLVSIEPDNHESPKSFTIVYNYAGIAEAADYPTTFTAVMQNPYEGVMKLREYLFSLKEEKKIIM